MLFYPLDLFKRKFVWESCLAKKVLILGIANEKSIAWGIARAMKEQGASLGLSYLNDQLKKRVEPLAEEVGADFIFQMDVTNEEHFPAMRKTVEEKWGKFDVLVHSLAFANRDDLKGRFSETTRAGAALACDVSAFSLISLCNELKGLMNDGGSVMAMTYHGSVKVLKGYNIMGVAKAALESTARYLADDLGEFGIRVNCISAGPIRTLASSGVSTIKEARSIIEEKSPLRRNISTEDVGGVGVFLGSDLSRGVSGQVVYVDSGISIVAM